MAVEGAAARASASPAPITHGRVLARLSRWTEQALTDVDLSLAQYRLLALLADGSTAAKGLARGLDVSPPTITTLVDGLVERGLVQRTRSAQDRRRVDHQLTPAGRRVLRAADAAVEARVRDLASHLGPDDAQYALEALDLWACALDAKRAALVAEHLS